MSAPTYNGFQLPVLSIPPNWADPLKLKLNYRTDIQERLDCSEERTNLQYGALFDQSYTITTTDARMTEKLRKLFELSNELPYIVPMWTEGVELTTAIIHGDITNNDIRLVVTDKSSTLFRERYAHAMLWQDWETWEIVSISGGNPSLGGDAPVDNVVVNPYTNAIGNEDLFENEIHIDDRPQYSWPVGTKVYPIMVGKVSKPTFDQLTDEHADIQIEFQERIVYKKNPNSVWHPSPVVGKDELELSTPDECNDRFWVPFPLMPDGTIPDRYAVMVSCSETGEQINGVWDFWEYYVTPHMGEWMMDGVWLNNNFRDFQMQLYPRTYGIFDEIVGGRRREPYVTVMAIYSIFEEPMILTSRTKVPLPAIRPPSISCYSKSVNSSNYFPFGMVKGRKEYKADAGNHELKWHAGSVPQRGMAYGYPPGDASMWLYCQPKAVPNELATPIDDRYCVWVTHAGVVYEAWIRIKYYEEEYENNLLPSELESYIDGSYKENLEIYFTINGEDPKDCTDPIRWSTSCGENNECLVTGPGGGAGRYVGDDQHFDRIIKARVKNSVTGCWSPMAVVLVDERFDIQPNVTVRGYYNWVVYSCDIPPQSGNSCFVNDGGYYEGFYRAKVECYQGCINNYNVIFNYDTEDRAIRLNYSAWSVDRDWDSFFFGQRTSWGMEMASTANVNAILPYWQNYKNLELAWNNYCTLAIREFVHTKGNVYNFGVGGLVPMPEKYRAILSPYGADPWGNVQFTGGYDMRPVIGDFIAQNLKKGPLMIDSEPTELPPDGTITYSDQERLLYWLANTCLITTRWYDGPQAM